MSTKFDRDEKMLNVIRASSDDNTIKRFRVKLLDLVGPEIYEIWIAPFPIVCFESQDTHSKDEYGMYVTNVWEQDSLLRKYNKDFLKINLKVYIGNAPIKEEAE